MSILIGAPQKNAASYEDMNGNKWQRITTECNILYQKKGYKK